jgi:hypothetical protein
MTTTMTNTRVFSLAEINKFLVASDNVSFGAINKNEAYGWIEDTLYTYRYHKLSKENKGTIQAYIRKFTGYSKGSAKRLTALYLKTGRVRKTVYKRHSFESKYTREDHLLLAKVDQIHKVLSGPATRNILEREYRLFDKKEFDRLSEISVSHIYNLRKTFTYREKVRIYNKTKPNFCPIGERRKPEPNGVPGYIRVDSVHQGDDPVSGKGIYHIHFVDEVIQWDLVGAVETICERHLTPVLEAILAQFPFEVINFHSDNGSEFINKIVARILEKLRITQTKSRPRKSNDNALIESKHNIIRKHMGYHHIPQGYASLINRWYQDWFNGYLNFHRPCGFAKIVTNAKGKEKYIYPSELYMTPYEKLKGLPNAKQYLRKEMTFDRLDKTAYAISDTDYAEAMQKAKQILFDSLQNK